MSHNPSLMPSLHVSLFKTNEQFAEQFGLFFPLQS